MPKIVPKGYPWKQGGLVSFWAYMGNMGIFLGFYLGTPKKGGFGSAILVDAFTFTM
jgi:hypothetical protein